MFTIYSIGDSAFLAQILNALAMICGTGDFKTLVGVGALLGLFVMGFQCLTSGTRQFNLHQVLIGIICYMCFFGPAVTVQIEDAYTDEVRVVDNVPLGAAAAGTMISNIGYGVTSLFEQGYGTADRMTEHAFLEPLKVLTGVRSAARDISIIEAAGKSIGNPSLAQDIDNYLRECTMVKITIGESTPDAMYRGGTNELFYNSTVYGTHLSGAGDVTCAEATQYIRQGLDLLGQQEAASALNRLLNIKEGGQTAPHMDKVDNALQMLDAVGNNGTQYLQLAVLEPLYEKAAAGFYKDMGDASAAVMVNQAIEQRNMQWSAEGSMFVSTMRPLMAFFEGFIYAITPLVGFLLVVGAFGMNLLAKYFQVVIWIQLWMPVMSIINLYVSMAARNEFASLVTTPISFYTLNTGSQALQTWLGIGGMLTAATPMIALFLVTGSTYAFTALAGRMGGADHVNERIGSPDMLKPGGYLERANLVQSDPSRGTTMTGAPVPEVSVGDALANREARGKQLVNTQAEQFGKAFNHAIESGSSHSLVRSTASQIGASLNTDNREAYNAIADFARSEGVLNDKNVGQTDAIVGSLTTALNARAGANASAGTNQKSDNPTYSHDWLSDSDGDGSFNLTDKAKGLLKSWFGSDDGAQGAPTLPVQPTQPAASPSGGSVSPANSKDKNPDNLPMMNRDTRSVGIDGGIGLSSNASGSASSTATQGSTASNDQGQRKGISISDGMQASLSRAVVSGVTKSGNESFSKTAGEKDTSGLSRAMTDLRSASDTYARIQDENRTVSTSQKMTLDTLANEVASNKELDNKLMEMRSVMSPSERDQVNKLTDKYSNPNGRYKKSKETGQRMALLETIGNSERLGGQATLGDFIYETRGLASPAFEQTTKPSSLTEPTRMSKEDINAARTLNEPQGLPQNFNERFETLGKETSPEQMVETVNAGSKAFTYEAKNYGEGRLSELRHSAMGKAIDGLKKHDTSVMQSVGDWGSDIYDKLFVNTEGLKNRAEANGLTETQALMWTAFRNDHDAVLSPALSKALHDDVRTALGGDKADPALVQQVASDIEWNTRQSATTGNFGNMVSVLAFNAAAYDIRSGSGNSTGDSGRDVLSEFGLNGVTLSGGSIGLGNNERPFVKEEAQTENNTPPLPGSFAPSGEGPMQGRVNDAQEKTNKILIRDLELKESL